MEFHDHRPTHTGLRDALCGALVGAASAVQYEIFFGPFSWERVVLSAIAGVGIGYAFGLSIFRDR